ncbi:MAG: glycosyltransferase N-terminal domain-containing protein [Bacteroidia bacterium]
MNFFYNIFVYLYGLAIRIASLFNKKAGLWVSGRKNIFHKLELDFKNRITNEVLVWVHCASLGEFEQGRPIIEKIKKEKVGVKILLTFFSPSGFEIRKNYNQADYIYYLPLDTPDAAQLFVRLVKPNVAIFVKYEFWFNYLNELKKQNVPTYLVSGVFRANHYFFKSYGSWFRKQLSAFTYFYLQDSASEKLLNDIGYTNTTVAGDTRFDRVLEISKNVKGINFIKQFVNSKKVIVAGSTWDADIDVLSAVNVSDYKLIIAPHEVTEKNIQSVIQKIKESNYSPVKTLRYSQLNQQMDFNAEVLIIDNVGMLSSLYQYGTLAFIGGGFGKGIHNILEAATFGLPVVFGPNYQKFNEAKELIKKGGAFSVVNAPEFKKVIALLTDTDALQKASLVAKHYVESNAGATEKIVVSLTFK